MKLIQQGDVVLKAIGTLPRGERVEDDQTKAKILVFGESTGHKHAVLDEENACQVFRILNKLYIETKKPVSLQHEEHDAIEIPPGNYEIEIVREADHLAGVVRRVAD